MPEQEAAVTVLLLAREGEARQRLEAAIAVAGARLLRAIDPLEGDPTEAVALRPGAVLVALEPVIEAALERFDALLSDPGVLVMFDEAEVAAARDGWDAARWVRHLAAKLNGHQDVLPPGAAGDEVVHPAPGPLPEREFDPASIDLTALAATAQDLAAEVPRGDAFDPPRSGEGAGIVDEGPAFAGLVSAEDMDWSSSAGGFDDALADDPDVAALLAGGAAAPADAGDAPGGDPAGPGDAPADDFLVPGEGLSRADDDGPLGTRADAAAEVDPLTLGEGLSLADDDAPLAPDGSATAPPAIDLDALAARLDGLSLADPDSYGHGVLRGAVVVEAGLGGPDAVRQLLAGLGDGFARAVLVRLQLDGGRYDRLVQQMQRASALPVAVAEPGATAEAGTVYFLPPDLAVVDDRARLSFAVDAGAAGGYDALPAADSAILFLSGAQPGRVDAAMAMAADGALVLAQAPDSCHDREAADALVARGAAAAEPADLAQAALDRWP